MGGLFWAPLGQAQDSAEDLREEAAEATEETTLEPAPDAEEAPTLRALFRIASPLDQMLLPRIHGQTSDLELELVESQGAGLEARLRDQLSAADRLLDAEGANVAVWFLPVRGRDAVDVVLSIPETNRVLIRQVGPDGTSDVVSSATLEEAALVVRGALQALVEGVEVGVSREQAVAQHEERDEPEEEAPLEPPLGAVSPLAPYMGAKVEFGADGRSPFHVAPGIEAGLVWGALSFGVAGTWGLSRQVEDEQVLISMARHGLSARIGYRWDLGSFTLSPTLHAGATFYRRRTLGTAAGVQATPNRVTVAASLGSSLQIELYPGLPWLCLVLTLGAEVVPGAPDFGYMDGDRFRQMRTPWYIQPIGNVGVRVFLDSPRQDR